MRARFPTICLPFLPLFFTIIFSIIFLFAFFYQWFYIKYKFILLLFFFPQLIEKKIIKYKGEKREKRVPHPIFLNGTKTLKFEKKRDTPPHFNNPFNI